MPLHLLGGVARNGPRHHRFAAAETLAGRGGAGVEDIDSASMLLHIRNAKRGRERYVMLSPRLLSRRVI